MLHEMPPSSPPPACPRLVLNVSTSTGNPREDGTHADDHYDEHVGDAPLTSPPPPPPPSLAAPGFVMPTTHALKSLGSPLADVLSACERLLVGGESAEREVVASEVVASEAAGRASTTDAPLDAPLDVPPTPQLSPCPDVPVSPHSEAHNAHAEPRVPHTLTEQQPGDRPFSFHALLQTISSTSPTLPLSPVADCSASTSQSSRWSFLSKSGRNTFRTSTVEDVVVAPSPLSPFKRTLSKVRSSPHIRTVGNTQPRAASPIDHILPRYASLANSPNVSVSGAETRVEEDGGITAATSAQPDGHNEQGTAASATDMTNSLTMIRTALGSFFGHAASSSTPTLPTETMAKSMVARTPVDDQQAALSVRHGRKTYTVYKVAIKSATGQEWLVYKRYSEFHTLDRMIAKQYPSIHRTLPELPPKRMFFTSLSPEFIQNRARGLNLYVQEIFASPVLLRCPYVRDFLCGSSLQPAVEGVDPRALGDGHDDEDEAIAVDGHGSAADCGDLDDAATRAHTSDSDDGTEDHNDNDDHINLIVQESIAATRVDKSLKITGRRDSPAKPKTRSADDAEGRGVGASLLKATGLQRLKRIAWRSSLFDLRPFTSATATERAGAATYSSRASDCSDDATDTASNASRDVGVMSDAGDNDSDSAPMTSIDDFYLLKLIGKGNFGKVMLAQHKECHRVYAIKVISKAVVRKKSKNSATGQHIDRIMTERNVLIRNIRHPFLIGLRCAFQTKDKLYFVTDYVNGGELFFHLQRERRFSELRSRFYAAEILSALAFLHVEVDVVYRDLKPENILLDASGHIKLTDFGLAKEHFHANNHGKTRTFCGTPEYLAPEVLRKESYGFPVDWWCLGAILFEMLVGLPPFYSQDNGEMYEKILNEKLRFPPHVSSRARSLICGLLHRVPNFRLGSGPNGTSTPEAVKAHPFFEGIDWQKLDGLKYRPPFVPQVAHMFDVRNIDPQFVNEPIPQSVLDDGLLRGLAGESALSGARAQPPPPPRQKHSLQQFEVEVTGISSAAAASIASPLSPELASPLSPDLASPLSKNKLETTTSTGKMPTAFKDSFKGFSFAGDGGNWLAVRDEER